jgi:hypothetical protein
LELCEDGIDPPRERDGVLCEGSAGLHGCDREHEHGEMSATHQWTVHASLRFDNGPGVLVAESIASDTLFIIAGSP